MMRRRIRKWLAGVLTLALLFTLAPSAAYAETSEGGDFFALDDTYGDDYGGNDMWLRYDKLADGALLTGYKDTVKSIVVQEDKAVKPFLFADTDYYEEQYGVRGEIQQAPGSIEEIPETTLQAARFELERALKGLFGVAVPTDATPTTLEADGAVVVGTPDSSDLIDGLNLDAALAEVGDEGYLIKSVVIGGKNATAIAANTEIGALYGTYAFLRLIQTQKPITGLDVKDFPKVNHRRINSWDRERFFAGNNPTNPKNGLNGESGFIFNWDLAVPNSDTATSPNNSTGNNNAHSTAQATRLPFILDRYVKDARAMAAVGINEFNINLVNTNSAYMQEYVIRQEAALADLLRIYGIKIGLSANYGNPTLAVCNYQGNLTVNGVTYPKDDTVVIGANNAINCDPGNPAYQQWWADKTKQIQKKIPDFFGYTVKANSEGQPGPQNYGFTHAEGANGMAEKLQELGVTIFWRSFVYNPEVDNDRLNRAYMEFGPADDPDDGKDVQFLDNVFVQTKNTPLDFQPREPVHPMFGRMPNTNQAVELQLTMEYLGHAKMATYLGTMFEEFFKWDTYAEGPGTLVGEILDGSAQGQSDTAIVGVNNMGNSDSVTGHHFLQANTYAFGRMAWDWTLGAEEVADEWARMTWGNDQEVIDTIVAMMMGSREAVVASQSPLGLMHQQTQGSGDHYGPGPWEWGSQDDWGPSYYNKADNIGIGFPRTEEGRIEWLLPVPEPGSGNENYYPLVNQYFSPIREMFANIETCPEEYLLAFHHVPWDYEMNSGRTLWEELVYRYQMGVQYSTYMIEAWDSIEDKIDARRFTEVQAKLKTQEADQARWRDECIKYFQNINGLDIPTDSAPLSIQIKVAGETKGGFDLSRAIYYTNPTTYIVDTRNDTPVYRSYTIGVPYGTTVPTISEVLAFDDDADVTILKQAANMDDTAVVKVVKDDFFGTIIQNYTFEFEYDTALKSVTIDGKPLTSFDSKKLSYTAYPASRTPVLAAVANDPAATVTIAQAASPGTATITVTNNGAPQTVYTLYYGDIKPAEEGFDSPELDSKWEFTREDAAAWSLSKVPGAMTITADAGTIQGGTNTTKNILLQDAPAGDWIIETKVNLSKALDHVGEQVGLIAALNDSNYVSIAWRRNATTAGIQAGTNQIRLNREQGGSATTFNGAGIDTQRAAGLDGKQIWLRIEKRGNGYLGSFSHDGVNFRPIRLTAGSAATAALPTLNVVPTKVGVFASDDTSTVDSTRLEASFDYFRITTKGEIIPASTDKTELDTLYDTQKPVLTAGKVNGGYTDGSWVAFVAAMSDAEALLADNMASQEEVDAACAALAEAVSKLKSNAMLGVAIDLLEAAIAIAEANVGDESDYTGSTWADYEDALNAALDMLDSPDDYTLQELLDGSSALVAAIQGLEFSADKSNLQMLITSAAAMLLPENVGKYIPAAVGNLEDVLADAQAVFDDADATQDEVNAAANDLLAAITQMFDKANKAQLQTLVNLVASYVESKYTPATWSVFADALGSAQLVLANENAVQSQVDSAYAALLSATTGLKMRANFASLDAAIKQAQNILLNADDYVASTLVGLQDQTNAALTVFNNKNSTQTQIDAARAALMAKVLNARLKADKSPILNALAIVSGLNLNLYTTQSVQPLSALVTEAQAVLPKEDVYQADIDDLAARILGAINNLILRNSSQNNAAGGTGAAGNTPGTNAGTGSESSNESEAATTTPNTPGTSSNNNSNSPSVQTPIEESDTPLSAADSEQGSILPWVVAALLAALLLVIVFLALAKRRRKEESR